MFQFYCNQACAVQLEMKLKKSDNENLIYARRVFIKRLFSTKSQICPAPQSKATRSKAAIIVFTCSLYTDQREKKGGLYLHFPILHLQFCLVEFRFKRQSCDLEWSIRHQYYCGFELGNILSCTSPQRYGLDDLNR